NSFCQTCRLRAVNDILAAGLFKLFVGRGVRFDLADPNALIDIILFTGGAGENQWEVREGATEGLEFMGVKMDEKKNRSCRAKEAILSADDSKVTVCCIPTDEELMIALDTLELTK
ncbi:MAG: hypothetical protein II806_03895, partial [Bacteroidaceae bacterium]|nr:hypothetical protein [Bacteroidaceae bacterium]